MEPTSQPILSEEAVTKFPCRAERGNRSSPERACFWRKRHTAAFLAFSSIGVCFVFAYKQPEISPISPATPVTKGLGLLAVGEAAPDFLLNSYEDSTSVRLADLRGRYVLLCFFCGCTACRAQASLVWSRVHEYNPSIPVTVLGISSMAEPSVIDFRRETHLSSILLFDPNYDVATRYGALDCPRTCIISPTGNVVLLSEPSDSPSYVLHQIQKCFLQESQKPASYRYSYPKRY